MAGIFWAAMSGVGFGLFQVLNRRAGRSIDAYRGTFILLAISTLILAAASLFSPDLPFLAGVSWTALANFSLAGLLHFFLGWTLLSLSQHRVGAARTGAFVGAAPLFATFIAALTLGEYLDLPTIAGILLVVGGVYLVTNG